MTATITMNIGDAIAIQLGAGLYGSSNSLTLATSGIYGEIMEMTEKAVKICAPSPSGKEMTAWLPLKALKIIDSYPLAGHNVPQHSCKVLGWFKPTGWTARFMELAQRNDVLSA